MSRSFWTCLYAEYSCNVTIGKMTIASNQKEDIVSVIFIVNRNFLQSAYGKYKEQYSCDVIDKIAALASNRK